MNSPSSHCAIAYHQFGEPSEVLTLTQATKLVLAPDQIRVKMLLSSINPSDLITIRGIYKERMALPRVVGYEGVGIVVERGANVNFPPMGSRVLALRGEGTWQEYVVVSATEAVLVPNEIDDQTAAQLYINPLTAWTMLQDEIRYHQGSTIAMNAAGSAFCRVFILFAKLFGYEIIAIVRNNFYTERLLKAGVKEVIDSSTTNVEEAVLDLTNGQGVAAVLDAIGGEEGDGLAKCVQNGGKMLHYGLLSEKALSMQTYHAQLKRGLKIVPYRLRDWVYKHDISYRQQVFSAMMEALINACFSLPVEREYPLEQIFEAVRTSEESRRSGKILLKCSSLK
ncbi:MAG: zinc-dependent alcohol dehydrogenase family protein [Legionellales bacterium]|nr:zinc-dependent alcohol dehydrogenase family protein [Legionellales bacterium]